MGGELELELATPGMELELGAPGVGLELGNPGVELWTPFVGVVDDVEPEGAGLEEEDTKPEYEVGVQNW